jgi:WD40 repeat protein
VPHSRLLVVGGDNGFLALVDPVRGKLVTRLRGHNGPLNTPSFSADGRLMATTSNEATILWTCGPANRSPDQRARRSFLSETPC